MLGVAGAVIIFILLAGAPYQGVATALERREFPRPGGLVSVGGSAPGVDAAGEHVQDVEQILRERGIGHGRGRHGILLSLRRRREERRASLRFGRHTPVRPVA